MLSVSTLGKQYLIYCSLPLSEESENVTEFHPQSGVFEVDSAGQGGSSGYPTQLQTDQLGVSGQKLIQIMQGFNDAYVFLPFSFVDLIVMI
jgi:hypothetical protein